MYEVQLAYLQYSTSADTGKGKRVDAGLVTGLKVLHARPPCLSEQDWMRPCTGSWTFRAWPPLPTWTYLLVCSVTTPHPDPGAARHLGPKGPRAFDNYHHGVLAMPHNLQAASGNIGQCSRPLEPFALLPNQLPLLQHDHRLHLRSSSTRLCVEQAFHPACL